MKTDSDWKKAKMDTSAMEGEYVSLFVGSLAIHYMHLRFSRVSSDTWTARLKVDLLPIFVSARPLARAARHIIF